MNLIKDLIGNAIVLALIIGLIFLTAMYLLFEDKHPYLAPIIFFVVLGLIGRILMTGKK